MNLAIYKKKVSENKEEAAMDRALKGLAASSDKARFEVFAIHQNGYISREALCMDHLHSTLLDACMCAGLQSAGNDLSRYGIEVEIVCLVGAADFHAGLGLKVVERHEIVDAFEKLTRDRRGTQTGYRGDDGYGACSHKHESITDAAMCVNAFEPGRGFAPCGTCTRKDAITIFTASPCYRHSQTAGVVDMEGARLTPRELEFGIRLEQLTREKSPPAPSSEPYGPEDDELPYEAESRPQHKRRNR